MGKGNCSENSAVELQCFTELKERLLIRDIKVQCCIILYVKILKGIEILKNIKELIFVLPSTPDQPSARENLLNIFADHPLLLAAIVLLTKVVDQSSNIAKANSFLHDLYKSFPSSYEDKIRAFFLI